MSISQATFDQITSSLGTVNTETWIDLGLISSGKQVWLGFCTFTAEDKNLVFEMRTNNTGQSTGTVGTTTLQDWSSTPGGSSIDRDFFHGGATAVMSVLGTGVEHWWLRIKSGSNAAGNYSYIIYYALY